PAELAVWLGAYLLAGHPVLRTAASNLIRGRVFDEHFLMTVATLGAIAIWELPEAAAVMLFFAIGERVQDAAVDRSRRSIRALMDVRPETAQVLRGGELLAVPPEEVAVGEEIVVRPGEKAPLDGEVVEGSSWMDTSALTGESVPRRAAAGDAVLAGSISQTGLLRIRVTRPFAESSVSKILALVEEAAHRKAETERFITTFARHYTPWVVAIAAATAFGPPLF